METHLEAELSVRRTLERYMRFNDDKRLDQILPLFAADAVYRVAGRTMTGHAQISALLDRGLAMSSVSLAFNSSGVLARASMPRSA